MNLITIEPWSLFIDDEKVADRVGSKLSFCLHKDPSGDVVVVAVNDECGRKVYGKKRRRVNTPAFLHEHEGKKMMMYQELLRPLSGEVFRLRPVDFKFKGSRATSKDPYLTKTCITIPQMFINEHLDMVHQGLGVRFNATTNGSIADGYVIAEIIDISHGKTYVDDFRIWECGSGLRSGKLSSVIDLLQRKAKDLTMYSYVGIMDNMMFFRERD